MVFQVGKNAKFIKLRFKKFEFLTEEIVLALDFFELVGDLGFEKTDFVGDVFHFLEMFDEVLEIVLEVGI